MVSIFEKQQKHVQDFLNSYCIQKQMRDIPGKEEESSETNGALCKKNSFASELAAGQIRLLAETKVITYAVLLRRWEKDSFVVMPFSHYDFPATDQEFKPEFDGGMYLNTLQAWNTRTLQDASLKKSWLIGSLPDSDCRDAWRVWEYSLGGAELEERLLEKTGLPILLDSDPRLQYLEEELENFQKLDAEDGSLQQEFDFSTLTPLWQMQQYALAAGDEKQDMLAECTPYGYKEFVTIVFSPREKCLRINIYTADQSENSHAFDSWELIAGDGSVLTQINDGFGIVRNLESFDGKCALRNPADQNIVIFEKK